ncbi:MAG: hypothetical protein ACJA1Z_001391 [Patiriisocius sp.]|jgi:hypothetical protein
MKPINYEGKVNLLPMVQPYSILMQILSMITIKKCKLKTYNKNEKDIY